MLIKLNSEEGLLVGVDALLVAIVDEGTDSDSTNDSECYTSIDAVV